MIRFRGTIASADQRETLRREIESIRASLEQSVDVRITTLDLSAMQLVPESRPKTQPEMASPGETGEYPGGVHPSPFAPENPPAESGRKWPWKRGKSKDSHEGSGKLRRTRCLFGTSSAQETWRWGEKGEAAGVGLTARRVQLRIFRD